MMYKCDFCGKTIKDSKSVSTYSKSTCISRDRKYLDICPDCSLEIDATIAALKTAHKCPSSPTIDDVVDICHSGADLDGDIFYYTGGNRLPKKVYINMRKIFFDGFHHGIAMYNEKKCNQFAIFAKYIDSQLRKNDSDEEKENRNGYQ